MFELPPDVEQAVRLCKTEMARDRFDDKIWANDTTLWHGDGEEMAERLGWLHVEQSMSGQAVQLAGLRDELVAEGYTDAVLLGMGGSSLGAEVIARMLGKESRGLRVHILDSIVPEAVSHVREAIDLPHSVFIVSSKSGTTLEPNLLYEYFRALVERRARVNAGHHFIAITDSGSSLDRIAATAGFRRTFLNPPEIGGRYSVLSLFGLVPGALADADVGRLQKNADSMARLCRPKTNKEDNPGTALGAYLGGCVRSGRDKLGIVTSPASRAFGWWAEQLVAESTGKDGTGIIPVVDEPFLSPEHYSSDRAFVYVRLGEDGGADAHIRALVAAGQPCATIDMVDAYSLGGEFFRWEYATACAGALLRIDPFNQPDVQSAKDAGNRVLERYVTEGNLPHPGYTVAPQSLLSDVSHGSYFALMAYLRRRDEVDNVVGVFRRRVAERFRIATTFGYGPRFLHSTGQLHKGGPPTGRFLQIVCEHPVDVPLPERPYTFGVASDAQAEGDLEALQSLGRHVSRIRLDRDDADELAARLAELV